MKVAILGLGSAGRRHAGHVAALGHEVVGWDPVQDGDAAGADAAIAAADAVIVASPNVVHREQALAAIAAGRPVLVEKPLALDAAGATEVAAAARAAGVVGAVAMNLRFLEPLATLQRLVAAGDLGPVRHATAAFGYDLRRWRPGSDWRASYSARRELGGGILLDAIHELDLVLWMLGPAQSVAADLATLVLDVDVEDTADLLVRHGGGARSAIHLNFHEPAYRRSLTVVGERAVAAWSWGAGLVVRRAAAEDRTVSPPGELDAAYRAVVADFLRAVRDGTPPRTPLEDGVAALALADAARAASASGCRQRLS